VQQTKQAEQDPYPAKARAHSLSVQAQQCGRSLSGSVFGLNEFDAMPVWVGNRSMTTPLRTLWRTGQLRPGDGAKLRA